MAAHWLFALGFPCSTILERHRVSAEEELLIPQQMRLAFDHAFLSRKIITNTFESRIYYLGACVMLGLQHHRREGDAREMGTPWMTWASLQVGHRGPHLSDFIVLRLLPSQQL